MTFTPGFGQDPGPSAPSRISDAPGADWPTGAVGAAESTDAPGIPESGWRPDPSDPDLERFWTGYRWTARVRDRATGIERVIAPPGWEPPRTGRLQRGRRRRKPASMLLTVVLVGLIALLGTSVASRLGLLPESADLTARAADLVVGATKPEPVATRYPVNGSTELVEYLAAAMVAQEESINVSYWQRTVGEEAVDDAMREALTQNPYIYARGWLSRIGMGGATIMPEYTYDYGESERRRVATASAVEVGLSASGARDATDDADKVALIHDYLVDVGSYDMAAFEAISAGDSTSALVSRSQEAYGLLVEGTAVCNGYAQAFLAMAHAVGLEAVEVTGSDTGGATGGDHAWNKVLIDGRWLLVDVTWDDVEGGPGTRDDYLLVSDSDPILLTRTTDAEWIVDENLFAYAG
ncbi:DUF2510 domain-containing protein [Demequina mangrovi]|uniref:Transglutaminase-like domain-containing protein n=1 Tax=Demequina mangrovi TaxID=1043493 RepID=A0A1H6YZQ3_9MICO|nr:DUF2510 domain-containing protein [Demequina mangrovi]SEJ45866.1 Protein of unknown function [Demequina mangrovi]